MKNNQRGIAHTALLLLVVVVAVAAFAGYKVMQGNQNADQPASTTKTAAGQTIQSKADLNSAESSLNNQNIDSDLNPGQFDQDVNSLL